jgi:hypothetical protein
MGRKDVECITDLINADIPDFYSKAKGLFYVATLKRYQVVEVLVHTGLEGEQAQANNIRGWGV